MCESKKEENHYERIEQTFYDSHHLCNDAEPCRYPCFCGSGGNEGKKISMSVLGIAGWFPSKLGVDMSPAFAEYARKQYGYDVEFTFDEAPFDALFQKAASTLVTQSDKYNIIVSDSQWLGGFSAPGWIVKLNGLDCETE